MVSRGGTSVDSVREQVTVSSGGQKLAAVLREQQACEARSGGFYPHHSIQGAAMKQQNAGLHITTLDC